MADHDGSDRITPVILCGGSGTRLWPVSRRSFPKQFAPLAGDESLFRRTVRRLTGPDFAAPVAVTGADFRFVVAEQMLAEGVDPGAILIEPDARNTAPAALAAALWLARRDPGALMLIAPSDHLIADDAGFRAAVLAARPAARDGRIVVFGVAPDRPETGYGWIEPGPGAGVVPVRRFVEKPAADLAAALLAEGGHLWNMGIFLCTPAALCAAFDRHAPDLVAPVRAAFEGAEADLGFLRLAPGPWQEARPVSLDYAVIEHADTLAVQPYAGAWSDLGDWSAVQRELGDAATPAQDRALALDCEDTLLRAESPDQVLVGIGLRGIVAVAMPDAVLVADRSRTQEVKRAVEALSRAGAAQAADLPRSYRPWGWFEVLSRGPRFQVKRIAINPGGRLSLQRHIHRSEHWVVVSGTVRVTLGDTVTLLTENESTFIPLGERHRLENPGRLPATLIEVQTGAYLGEDDIERLEDAYARDRGR